MKEQKIMSARAKVHESYAQEVAARASEEGDEQRKAAQEIQQKVMQQAMQAKREEERRRREGAEASIFFSERHAIQALQSFEWVSE
jgi:hypothetical protein